MQAESLESPDSSCDSFKTSLDKSEKPSWRSPAREEMSEDVTFQPLHPVSLERTPSIAQSINCKDDKLHMSISISSVQAAEIITSETLNPLSIQHCPPLSLSSSNMVKRIVENQNLLIWQAYDSWRQKFPRIELEEEDEDVEETELKSEVEDDLSTSETLAVEA